MITTSASAAPGDLDPSFGDHGIGVQGSGGGDIEVLDDGRILVLADTASGWAVRCFDSEGNLDRSFGNEGAVQIDGGIEPRGLAVEPNGRILVVGQQFGVSPDFFYYMRVYRFLPDGQPDPSFGQDGQTTLDFGTGRESPHDVDVDETGTILIAGRIGEDQAVVGLAGDGVPDPAFGDAGVVALPEGTAVGIDHAPGGDHLVAGIQLLSPILMFTRIRSDGEIETSYGSGGSRALIGGGGNAGYPGGELAVSSSGRLAFGSTTIQDAGHGSSIGARLVVLDAQGDVDAGFDLGPASGIVDRDKSLAIDGVAWDASGRLLVSGSQIFQNYPFSGFADAFIARLLPDGSLDPKFGEAGVGWFPANFSTFPAGYISAPTVQADGRIVAVAGRLVRFLDGGALADADADGFPDNTDLCPRRFSELGDGCQEAATSLTMRYRHALFRGTVETARICLAPRSSNGSRALRVKLFRLERGPDLKIDSVHVGAQGRFEFKRDRKGDRYIAGVRGRVRSGIVYCSPARSSRVPG